MFIIRTAIFALLLITLGQSKRLCEKCPYAFRCSPYYDERVWSLEDGKLCKVHANGCMLGSYDCNRKNSCLQPTTHVTKEECQKFCAKDCENEPNNVVCAWFPNLSKYGASGGEYKEFPNKCEMNRYSCIEEKPYASENEGSCQVLT